MIAMKNPEGGIVFKTLFRLVRLLPPNFKFRGAMSFLFLFVNSGLDLAGLGAIVPLITVVLEDDAIEKSETLSKLFALSGLPSEEAFIAALGVIVLLVIATKNGISLMIHYYQAKFSYDLQRFFSLNLFQAFYSKGYLFFKETNSSKLFRNIQAVPNVFALNMLLPLMSVLNEIIIVTFIAVALLVYDPLIVVLLLVIVGPAFLIFYQGTKRKAQTIAEQQHTLTPKLYKNLMEAVYGYIDVQITNTKTNFYQRHEKVQGDLMGYQTLAQVLKMAPTKIIETAMILGVVSMIIYGVVALDSRSEMITLLSVFAIAAYRVLPSVNRMLVGVMSLNAYKYTLNMIERESAYKARLMDSEHHEDVEFEHQVRLENVDFRYSDDSDLILDAMNLDIAKGQVIGIIGKSGSGKSTLVNLLLGFLNPTKGRILIDSLELNDERLRSWRDKVGYVQQDVFLADTTLRENVAFGIDEDKIDDERVKESLIKASLSDFLESEDGLNMRVGERGGQLSGGQRQRIGIARALYSGAKVLFFDEATSALDNETEKEVTEAIHKLSQEDLTLIIIAHRITTLKYCDRIIELESGKIKGEVTYDALVEKTI